MKQKGTTKINKVFNMRVGRNFYLYDEFPAPLFFYFKKKEEKNSKITQHFISKKYVIL